MTAHVVDASVAVKWYVPEVHSVEASQLLIANHELHVPDLLLVEFGNILWKKVRRGEVSPDEAKDILAELSNVPLQVHASDSLVERALEIALDHSRTVYDSLYLALAESLACQVVTADDRLSNSMQGTVLASHLIHVRDFV